MRAFYRNGLLATAAVAAIASVFFLDPIPQDPAYHAFADRRALAGVPNFWNVATNLPFLFVGLLGFARANRLASPRLRVHYHMLCAAVALVAIGSGCYHLAPSNATLVWDRLPMTVAFMSLLSAVVAPAWLWPFVAAGITSIAWWIWTESAGQGDLRPYAIVQFLPALLIPLTRPSGWLWAALGAYAAAKIFEHFDAEVFSATGFVSGHSLKHLMAALAAWWIIRAFQRSPASAL